MDDCFWEELAELDPDDVCRRSAAGWTGESYQIRILGRDYLLTPGERRLIHAEAISREEEESVVSGLCFVAVHYLLNARDVPPAGELVGASELKGGKLFFSAGAHSPDFSSLEEIFSASPEAMVRAAEALGGGEGAHGDIAVEVRALPRLPISFVFWREDEEFPASVSMLFDRTADRQLPLDVILALAQETMGQLMEKARQEMGKI
ncbi:MAG: DUF3786 domain-containing protein [Gemmatimonadetes bacterium]|nr:DUF3786 domain-containing protein [Gemmatimonadota bacterium]